MKKALLCATLILLLSPAAFAAHALTIGSGQGSLSVDIANDYGFINGSDATFDATGTGNSGTTIWNYVWLIYDVTNDIRYYSDDYPGAQHTSNLLSGGSPVATSTSLTTTGIPLSASVTLDMAQTLTAPAVSDTAQLETSWTFNNGGGSPVDYRIVLFVDFDGDLEGSAYTDDLVAAIPSAHHAGVAMAVGNNSSSMLDLNAGMLTECTTHQPSAWHGFSDGAGPSGYWSNTGSWTTTGIESAPLIDPSLALTVQNDAGPDYLSDTGTDCGVALQVDVTVPNGGSETVTFASLWGDNQLLSMGSLPVELSVFGTE